MSEGEAAQLVRLLSQVRVGAQKRRAALIERGALGASEADPLAHALDHAEATIDLATDLIVELGRTGTLEVESWIIAEELLRDLGAGVAGQA